ncbi:conserved hypothetical protein [Synechococcus sp. CC9902]|uniref:peptidylprolyl isomerase n=1 Tax=Synechococcus sp. (strain CC9902) TaxID=316279 RepID=UPI00005D3D0D|nr:peptidylprolyl isomerase [Synechococcus sp. CC9902]ABB25091.1 conserved hypothetical protein [Synechococcus sp. CC9902]
MHSNQVHLFSDGIDSAIECQNLVRRMQIFPKLVRFQQEELIASQMNIGRDFLDQERQKRLNNLSLDDFLRSSHLKEDDLDICFAREEALLRFAEKQFGPGLEEVFLSSKGAHDQVIYSILRVRDAGLAQELWIRLEENEGPFTELAASFGEGPEASHKGLMGPTAMGSIYPQELAQLLRSLRPGEIHPPRQLGEWLILIRLEVLTPARFDKQMRTFLLHKQLDTFLDARVKRIMSGETVDELNFDF